MRRAASRHPGRPIRRAPRQCASCERCQRTASASPAIGHRRSSANSVREKFARRARALCCVLSPISRDDIGRDPQGRGNHGPFPLAEAVGLHHPTAGLMWRTPRSWPCGNMGRGRRVLLDCCPARAVRRQLVRRRGFSLRAQDFPLRRVFVTARAPDFVRRDTHALPRASASACNLRNCWALR